MLIPLILAHLEESAEVEAEAVPPLKSNFRGGHCYGPRPPG